MLTFKHQIQNKTKECDKNFLQFVLLQFSRLALFSFTRGNVKAYQILISRCKNLALVDTYTYELFTLVNTVFFRPNKSLKHVKRIAIFLVW